MLNVECVDGLPMMLTLNCDYCHQQNLHNFTSFLPCMFIYSVYWPTNPFNKIQ